MTTYATNESKRIHTEHVLFKYAHHSFSELWRNLPEIPSREEILPTPPFVAETLKFRDSSKFKASTSDPLPKNKVDGPWSSDKAYLETHYRLIREDAIFSLRSSVAAVKAYPTMLDDRNTSIYTSVHFRGIQVCSLGVAFRIEFSHERAGKQIKWAQSRRLRPGSLIALTPQRDMFQTICKVATVADRPETGGWDQNPPQIDIFWGNDSEAVFDPVEPYVMVESRTGYFEATRHILTSLQKLATERLPLQEQLIDLSPKIGPPNYLVQNQAVDLSPLAQSSIKSQNHYSTDIPRLFPPVPQGGMDASQFEACQRIMASKVAIVQGPPGTGKTHVSVAALRLMTQNMKPGDPPIIISAQTNHALDQLLTLVSEFESRYLRLGGRFDKGNEDIRAHTLFHFRKQKRLNSSRRGLQIIHETFKGCVEEFRGTLSPLLSQSMLNPRTLLEYGIIAKDQYDSLYDKTWVYASDSQSDGVSGSGPFAAWLGSGQIIPMPRAPPIDMSLPVEDDESDAGIPIEDELDSELMGSGKLNSLGLGGAKLQFQRRFTGRYMSGFPTKKLKPIVSAEKSLYDIPVKVRGEVYRYFETQLHQLISEKFLEHLQTYREKLKQSEIIKGSYHIDLISHLGIKVIACTTTGLSKYRGLLSALQPKILLIEEAAETIESNVMGGLFESIEHLVLVGDHKQLPAFANYQILNKPPYNLCVSLFERLINNNIPYTMLSTQRRMIPDIRELLCIQGNCFYENLEDHPHVLDRKRSRPPVNGMGGKNTFFFHHTWHEARDANGSFNNVYEAEMIAGHVAYLTLNGEPADKITILTYYNGQRKCILRELRKYSTIKSLSNIRVVCIDGYQGEENDIVLLSLVRSNSFSNIGFLESRNRFVVALSRARRGLYLFGNAVTLANSESGTGHKPLWSLLLSYMKSNGRFQPDGSLPLTCIKHRKTVHVRNPDQWHMFQAGCGQLCAEPLSCGHQCPYRCHPFPHRDIYCRQACQRTMPCGHGCSEECGKQCYCIQCGTEYSRSINVPKAKKVEEIELMVRDLDTTAKETETIPNQAATNEKEPKSSREDGNLEGEKSNLVHGPKPAGKVAETRHLFNDALYSEHEGPSSLETTPVPITFTKYTSNSSSTNQRGSYMSNLSRKNVVPKALKKPFPHTAPSNGWSDSSLSPPLFPSAKPPPKSIRMYNDILKVGSDTCSGQISDISPPDSVSSGQRSFEGKLITQPPFKKSQNLTERGRGTSKLKPSPAYLTRTAISRPNIPARKLFFNKSRPRPRYRARNYGLPLSAPPAVAHWRAWDAKKSDQILLDERRRNQSQRPSSPELIINDTHHKVSIIDGYRVTSATVRHENTSTNHAAKQNLSTPSPSPPNSINGPTKIQRPHDNDHNNSGSDACLLDFSIQNDLADCGAAVASDTSRSRIDLLDIGSVQGELGNTHDDLFDLGATNLVDRSHDGGLETLMNPLVPRQPVEEFSLINLLSFD